MQTTMSSHVAGTTLSLIGTALLARLARLLSQTLFVDDAKSMNCKFNKVERRLPSSKFLSLVLLAVIPILLIGCGTTKMTGYDSNRPSAWARTLEKDGLSITLDPIFDKARAQESFSIDGFRDGVIILHLTAENRQPVASFHLEKRNTRLILPMETVARVGDQQEVKRSTAAGEGVAIAGASIGSPVAFAIGIGMILRETKIRNNLLQKEFLDQSISPLERAAGYIYFPFDPKTNRVDGALFQVRTENAQTHQMTEFEFPLPAVSKSP